MVLYRWNQMQPSNNNKKRAVKVKMGMVIKFSCALHTFFHMDSPFSIWKFEICHRRPAMHIQAYFQVTNLQMAQNSWNLEPSKLKKGYNYGTTCRNASNILVIAIAGHHSLECMRLTFRDIWRTWAVEFEQYFTKSLLKVSYIITHTSCVH